MLLSKIGLQIFFDSETSDKKLVNTGFEYQVDINIALKINSPITEKQLIRQKPELKRRLKRIVSEFSATSMLENFFVILMKSKF